MWGKPKNRRKSEGSGFRFPGALVARFGIAAAVLAVLGSATTLSLASVFSVSCAVSALPASPPDDAAPSTLAAVARSW